MIECGLTRQLLSPIRKREPIIVGLVKSNVEHLEGANDIASLINVLLGTSQLWHH